MRNVKCPQCGFEVELGRECEICGLSFVTEDNRLRDDLVFPGERRRRRLLVAVCVLVALLVAGATIGVHYMRVKDSLPIAPLAMDEPDGVELLGVTSGRWDTLVAAFGGSEPTALFVDGVSHVLPARRQAHVRLAKDPGETIVSFRCDGRRVRERLPWPGPYVVNACADRPVRWRVVFYQGEGYYEVPVELQREFGLDLAGRLGRGEMVQVRHGLQSESTADAAMSVHDVATGPADEAVAGLRVLSPNVRETRTETAEGILTERRIALRHERSVLYVWTE